MKPWSHAEEQALILLAPLGGRAVAAAFDRSHGAVRHRASALHVSLRRRAFGTRLGQCGPAVLRKVVEASRASLCPACAKRPIAVKNTGLCGACHLENLRTVHEAEIATSDAQRGLWAARSKLHRRRRKFEAADVSVTKTGDGSATMVVLDATDPEETASCTQ